MKKKRAARRAFFYVAIAGQAKTTEVDSSDAYQVTATRPKAVRKN